MTGNSSPWWSFPATEQSRAATSHWKTWLSEMNLSLSSSVIRWHCIISARPEIICYIAIYNFTTVLADRTASYSKVSELVSRKYHPQKVATQHYKKWIGQRVAELWPFQFSKNCVNWPWGRLSVVGRQYSYFLHWSHILLFPTLGKKRTRSNKKAELSQKWLRDAPYIWLPWKFLRVPEYAHGYKTSSGHQRTVVHWFMKKKTARTVAAICHKSWWSRPPLPLRQSSFLTFPLVDSPLTRCETFWCNLYSQTALKNPRWCLMYYRNQRACRVQQLSAELIVSGRRRNSTSILWPSQECLIDVGYSAGYRPFIAARH